MLSSSIIWKAARRVFCEQLLWPQRRVASFWVLHGGGASRLRPLRRLTCSRGSSHHEGTLTQTKCKSLYSTFRIPKRESILEPCAATNRYLRKGRKRATYEVGTSFFLSKITLELRSEKTMICVATIKETPFSSSIFFHHSASNEWSKLSTLRSDQ